MKRLTFLLSLLLVLSTIPQIKAGTISGEHIYQFGNFNFTMTELDYDINEKTLTVIAEQPSATYSIGLGLFVVKFNESIAPDFRGVKATINGQPAKDMLKNYTIVDGEYFIRTRLENGTVVEKFIPCVYMEVYFYIFENHTIIDERPIPHNINPEARYYPPSSEQDDSTIHYGEQVKLEIGNFNDTKQSQEDYMPFLLIAVIVPSVIVCIVLLPIYRRRAS